VPIISVGNITVGGTGKTPFVIWLAKKMLPHYKMIVVISRGYGRKSKGMLDVSDFREPQKFGDEPCLIAVSVPSLKVIVSEDRKIAVRYAQKKYQADLIILDDAFQHRSVERDVDIVLLNTKEKFKGNFPIPSGTLREFRHNIKRADIIIETNSAAEKNIELPILNKETFKSKSILNLLLNSRFEAVGKISDLRREKVIAFSGIAHPENFKNYLKDSDIVIESYFSYRDHYQYVFEDVKNMIGAAELKECKKILCTEKDMIKISAINELSQEQISYFYAVRLELEVGIEEKMIIKINNMLTSEINNRILSAH
jgi:tetraacyldisaccharide 4'-kinase